MTPCPDPYLAALREAEKACERIERQYADVPASTGAILCREEIKKMIERYKEHVKLFGKVGAVALALAALGCASKPACVDGKRYRWMDAADNGRMVDAVCHNGHLQRIRTNEEPQMPPLDVKPPEMPVPPPPTKDEGRDFSRPAPEQLPRFCGLGRNPGIGCGKYSQASEIALLYFDARSEK